MNINFNLLPWHILYKIYYFALNINECDINYNLNLRLVCKHWNDVVTRKQFIDLYSKRLRIDCFNDEDIIQNISINKYIKNIIKKNKKNILESNTNNKQVKIIIDKFITEKLYFNTDFLLNTHINYHLYNKIHPELLVLSQEVINDNLLGIDVLNIPVCYFKKSKCIQNICGKECMNNYHGLLDYTNHYISRGIDDKGCFYLLFFYKDYEKNRIFYEFIYTTQFKNNINTDYNVLTYSGYNNICYIGNLSCHYDNTMPYFKRRVKTSSYDYLLRLINFKKCGPVDYDIEKNKYIEYEYIYSDNSDDEEDETEYANQLDVSLYFDKKEIKKNINYNKGISYQLV
jgi:hypothetical protein